MLNRKLVYVIADYGDLHDLAFAEVKQRLYHELNDKSVNGEVETYAVSAFDTHATGFALAQTAINSRLGDNHKFYVNTAPRKDDISPRVDNAGEGFVYARLFNDVVICAVNSGYTLSLIKEAAWEIREINCENAGSQFRSRDLYPPEFARIAGGDTSNLGKHISPDHIPDFPDHALAYTDGYGNLKCAIDPDELEKLNGQLVKIDMNGRYHYARVAEGIFAVADGEFCISRGSSGWILEDGSKREFCEIVKRGGNAAIAFGRPPGGIAVHWRVA